MGASLEGVDLTVGAPGGLGNGAPAVLGLGGGATAAAGFGGA